MARILIADDNSNIQRMASLALKDAGIEVVAVGNGEAAVRKLPELMPDLVLADIFMPVRNGYEVCEFIKRDPRFANIPVVLLAGAFDPFDEQEAQRVQADGVLKKPFVPPDPLINAVKTLLAKAAGDRLMAVTVPVAGEASAAVEVDRATNAAPRVLEPPPVAHTTHEEFALPLKRLDFDRHEKPTPFASSREPAVAESDDPEAVVTATRDPVLGEPAFWIPAEEVAEAEKTEETPGEDVTEHTWSSDSRSVQLREEAPLLELEPLPEIGHEDFTFVEPTSADATKQWVAPVEPPAPFAPATFVHELTSFGGASTKDVSPDDTLPLPENWMESTALKITPLAPAASTHEPAGFEGVSTKDVSADDTLPLPEAWTEATGLEIAPLENSTQSEPSAVAAPTELPPIPAALIVNATSQSEQAPSENDDVAMLELAESLPTPTEPVPASWEPASPEPEPEPESQAHAEIHTPPEPDFAIEWPSSFMAEASPESNETPIAATEFAPAEHAAPSAIEPEAVSVQAPSTYAAPSALPAPPAPPAPPASLSPDEVEAVIQRVIARMQPQILEIVTREILRPLVEALVRHELTK